MESQKIDLVQDENGHGFLVSIGPGFSNNCIVNIFDTVAWKEKTRLLIPDDALPFENKFGIYRDGEYITATGYNTFCVWKQSKLIINSSLTLDSQSYFVANLLSLFSSRGKDFLLIEGRLSRKGHFTPAFPNAAFTMDLETQQKVEIPIRIYPITSNHCSLTLVKHTFEMGKSVATTDGRFRLVTNERLLLLQDPAIKSLTNREAPRFSNTTKKVVVLAILLLIALWAGKHAYPKLAGLLRKA
jgi:hypothetical protein